METIAFQKRSDELAEKQVKLHPDTYKALMSEINKNEGFTVSNIVNEALSYFLGVGQLAYALELAEKRLEQVGVSLPPLGQSELKRKNKSVRFDEKKFHQVYNVPTHKEWKHIDKEDSRIYLNTNEVIWEAAKDSPGRVSYIVNVAVEVWLSAPYSGVCAHLVTVQQLQAARDGDAPNYLEATEWVQRRMDGLRPESDGSHHEEWEELFEETEGYIGGLEWSEIRLHHDIEVEESAAIEAQKSDKLTETWKNRVGVMAAVLRNKPTPEDGWSREEVQEINNRVNSDMGEKTKRRYVDKVLENFNDDMFRFGIIELPEREDGTPISELPEIQEYTQSKIGVMNQVQAALGKAFDMGHSWTEYDLTTEEAKRVDEFAAEVVRMAPDYVFEVVNGHLVDWLESLPENMKPRTNAATTINSQTPASV